MVTLWARSLHPCQRTAPASGSIFFSYEDSRGLRLLLAFRFFFFSPCPMMGTTSG